MYSESIYFIALQNALGFASKALCPAILKFKTPQNIFAASKDELKGSGLFSKAQLERISEETLQRAKRIFSSCENSGVTVIPYGGERYPKRLMEISDPPAVLYVLGDMPAIDDQPVMTIVGSRKPTEYGAISAFNLSRALCSAGFIVVSGGALGVDSAAHEGALDVGGKTVAVLGTGFFSNYLMRQEPLRRRISQSGALVTEFPPGMPVQRFSFPMRNRIISGLSMGTAVVQASEKSGSLITASYAAEQGRDVFVIPGHAGEQCFKGSNELIKNGAKPIFSFKDIAEEYCRLFVGKIDLGAGELCGFKDKLPDILSMADGGASGRGSHKASEDGFDADGKPAFGKTFSEKENDRKQKADGGQNERTAKGRKTANDGSVYPDAAHTGSENTKAASSDTANDGLPPINKKFTDDEIQRDLSEDARLVYNSFRKSISLFDELSVQSHLNSGRLLCALTELELSGLVSALSGNRFEKL